MILLIHYESLTNLTNMKLTFRNIQLSPTKYGNDIIIKQVGLYDDNGKFIRNCKINQKLIEAIKNGTLTITP